MTPKPKYEEFTVEEIESLDNECAALAEENSTLQDRNAELLAALKAYMKAAGWEFKSEAAYFHAKQVIAKAEGHK